MGDLTLPITVLAAVASALVSTIIYLYRVHESDHRSIVSRLERELEKTEKQLDDALQLNRTLLTPAANPQPRARGRT